MRVSQCVVPEHGHSELDPLESRVDLGRRTGPGSARHGPTDTPTALRAATHRGTADRGRGAVSGAGRGGGTQAGGRSQPAGPGGQRAEHGEGRGAGEGPAGAGGGGDGGEGARTVGTGAGSREWGQRLPPGDPVPAGLAHLLPAPVQPGRLSREGHGYPPRRQPPHRSRGRGHRPRSAPGPLRPGATPRPALPAPGPRCRGRLRGALGDREELRRGRSPGGTAGLASREPATRASAHPRPTQPWQESSGGTPGPPHLRSLLQEPTRSDPA